MVADFMELYMLWRKLKRWGLLMSDLNVILTWFVLCLRLGLMLCGCFVIDKILVFITYTPLLMTMIGTHTGNSALGLSVFLFLHSSN